MTAAPCLSADALERLAAGELPEADEDEANAHLSDCPDCAAAYDGLGDPLVAALRGAPGADAGPPSGLVRRLKALPLAVSTVEQSRAALEVTPATDATPAWPQPADRFDMLQPPRGGGELGWLGKFRVVGVLGKGGMGTVFRAEDTALNRAVALKVIRPPDGHPATATQRERFLREARAAARLDHPHIVPVYEVGEADGTPYLAMPLLRGRTLADELAAGGPVAPPRLLRLARQVAEGLAAAHEAAMVHRDIKPSNLWVGPGPDGECARVLDFGLAKGGEAAGDDLTGDGVLVGTPAYMAPEQADLDPVTPRTDLFSLGVVFYEMAAGRPLFVGKSNREVLVAVRKFTPPRGAALLPTGGAFADIVAGLLAPDPAARRPATARELAGRLRELEDSAATPRSSPRRSRRRLSVFVGAAFAAALVAFMAGVTIRIERDKDGKPVVTVDVPRDTQERVVVDARDGTIVVEPATVSPPAPVAPAPAAPGTKADLWSPPLPPAPALKLPTLDHLRRELIPTACLAVAGGGDPAKAPPRLVAVLGGFSPDKKLSAVDGHTDGVTALAISPDGATLASAAADKTLRFWDLTAAVPRPVGAPRLLSDRVVSLSYSRDGQLLATGCMAGQVAVWESRADAAFPMFAWETGLPLFKVRFGHTGKLVAAGLLDDRARLYPLERGAAGRSLGDGRKPIYALAFTSDDRRLVCGSRGRLSVTDTATGVESMTTEPATGRVWFRALSQSPDGTLLAANGRGIRDGRREALANILPGLGNNDDKLAHGSFSVRDLNRGLLTVALLQHDARVLHSGFSGDGRRLHTVTEDNRVHLWDWRAESRIGAPFEVIPPFIDPKGNKLSTVDDVAFAPDGRHVFATTRHGLIYVLRLD